jgi:hypothetical protein
MAVCAWEVTGDHWADKKSELNHLKEGPHSVYRREGVMILRQLHFNRLSDRARWRDGGKKGVKDCSASLLNLPSENGDTSTRLKM